MGKGAEDMSKKNPMAGMKETMDKFMGQTGGMFSKCSAKREKAIKIEETIPLPEAPKKFCGC